VPAVGLDDFDFEAARRDARSPVPDQVIEADL
jgi:hypothetical protein